MFTKIIGALGVAMALNSCATVIRGVHEHLKVVSNPSGADVILSTGERGMTPATFVKRRRNSFQVTVSKPGYYSQTVTVRSKASTTGAAATAGNVATLGAGVAVDAGTGAWNSLYPNPVSVQLVPQPGEHPARQKRFARGGYPVATPDRKSTRLNSSHVSISYAVFCLK